MLNYFDQHQVLECNEFHASSGYTLPTQVGLARATYIRCIYDIFGREITKQSYTVYTYGSGHPYHSPENMNSGTGCHTSKNCLGTWWAIWVSILNRASTHQITLCIHTHTPTPTRSCACSSSHSPTCFKREPTCSSEMRKEVRQFLLLLRPETDSNSRPESRSLDSCAWSFR